MINYKKGFSNKLSNILFQLIPVKILFIAGILFSIFGYLALSRFENNKLREKFFNISEYQANLIQEAVEKQIVFLNSLHSFFESSKEVGYEEFNLFVHNLLSSLDEITSVYWVPIVKSESKNEFEKIASIVMDQPVSIIQRSSSGDFINAVPRNEYFPIFYAMPKEVNEKIIGFDLTSNYLCKAAIYNAIKCDSITASEKLNLLDEASDYESLFLFQPVYEEHIQSNSFKDNLSRIKGLLVIAININQFFEKELASKSFAGIKVSLYDISNPRRTNNIFSISSAGFKTNEPDRPNYLGSSLKFMTDIRMAGRHYLFCCEPEKSFLAAGTSLTPLLILLSGIFITFLLSGFYLNMITRTKEIEKLVKIKTHELRESEQKYRTLFETSKEAIILFNDESLIDFNTATLNMFGFYSRSQLINKQLPDFFNEVRDLQEDSFRISEFIRKSSKIKHQELEMSFRRFDGSVFIGEVVSQSFIMANDHILQVKIKDITERKKAEKAFRENQQLIQGIFNNTTAIIYVKDINGAYVLVNKQYEDLLNISNEDLIGKSDYHLFDNHFADLLTKYDKQVIESKSPIAVEEKIDTQHTYLSLKFPLFDEDDNVYAVCGMSTDITERKQNEEEVKKFKTMADSANFALALVNMDWSIHYINKYFGSLHGYADVDELKGQNFKLFHNQEQSIQFENLEKHLFETGGFAAEEVWHTALDGTRFPLLMNGVVIEGIDGKPLYMAFSAIEVSERKKIEEELIKTRKLESVGVLAGGIAHDFNNLLTSIIGNIALCKMDLPEKSNLISSLVNAEKAAVIAKELSQQLLTFTQSGAPLKTALSIETLIEDTVEFTLKGTDIKLDLSFEKNLLPVKINKTQISTVINNVVLNAVHAMPAGGEISISCKNVTNHNAAKQKIKYLKVSVADTGIGIPEENISKIFDPYFTTKEKSVDKGSGLGLTTSYSIIKKHGGYMEVQSVVGKGTTIDIFLPASLDNADANNEQQEKKHGSKKDIKDTKILIIDNKSPYRHDLEKIVVSMGCELQFIDYNKNTFEIYKNSVGSDKPFDAVILDADIALEAIEKLLAINPQAKTIITTVEKNNPLIKGYEQYGMNNIVSDPYSHEEIQEAFDKILHA